MRQNKLKLRLIWCQPRYPVSVDLNFAGIWDFWDSTPDSEYWIVRWNSCMLGRVPKYTQCPSCDWAVCDQSVMTSNGRCAHVNIKCGHYTRLQHGLWTPDTRYPSLCVGHTGYSVHWGLRRQSMPRILKSIKHSGKYFRYSISSIKDAYKGFLESVIRFIWVSLVIVTCCYPKPHQKAIVGH